MDDRRIREQPPVVVEDAGVPTALLRACPVEFLAILGFERPTYIPCGQTLGHDGPHRYEAVWSRRRGEP